MVSISATGLVAVAYTAATLVALVIGAFDGDERAQALGINATVAFICLGLWVFFRV